MSGLHIGRSWEGTPLEDDCPCHKAACGLVDEECVGMLGSWKVSVVLVSEWQKWWRRWVGAECVVCQYCEGVLGMGSIALGRGLQVGEQYERGRWVVGVSWCWCCSLVWGGGVVRSLSCGMVDVLV